MKIEIWKYVVGYEGLYMVSNLGRVKSLERKVKNNKAIQLRQEVILNQYTKKFGYKAVYLYKNGIRHFFSVHRLVAIAFIPNPNNYSEVNHKDCNPANNCAENLEWCSREYNNNYGGRVQIIAKKNTNRNKSIITLQYDLDGNLIKEWPSTQEIKRQLGFNSSLIWACCNNKPKHKTAYGYIWKYKKEVA